MVEIRYRKSYIEKHITQVHPARLKEQLLEGCIALTSSTAKGLTFASAIMPKYYLVVFGWP